MSDFDGNFMEMTSYWAPPSSPSPREIFAMLEQTDNGLNPITEIFPDQDNSPRDLTDQSEKRSGLGERIAARIGYNLPTLDTENMNPLSAIFRSTTAPSPVVPISPGYSPSALLQDPNMVTDSSQITPPSSATNYGPPEMVETFGEGNATGMIFNNDLPYQPMNVDMPPLEGFADIPIPTDESFYIPSYETHVEPMGRSTPLLPSFESELVGNANFILSEENESEPEKEDKEDLEYEDEDEDDEEDDEEETDHGDITEEFDDVGPSSPKRRKYEEGSNMFGATRTSKTQRVIFQMETDEDNPEDGYRWRKYGQKVVKGNPNPRSYYKCTNNECNVKKHVERGADDVKLIVTTYDGIHNHPSPPARSRINSRTRSGTTTSQNPFNRTSRLGRHSSPFSSVTPLDLRALSSFAPPMDLTRVYTTGLSKLPNIPVYQNPSFMYRNDEPRMNVLPDGSGVYGGIMHRLFSNFGVHF